MAELIEDDLYSAPSAVVNGGLGLFSRKALRAGSAVCFYCGDEHPTKVAIKLEDKSYLMRLGPQVYVDALPHPEVIARYINDCRNPRGFNVVFDKRPDEKAAAVIALRDIQPGEELFADYGKCYWASLKPSVLSNSTLGISFRTHIPTPVDAVLRRRRCQYLTDASLWLHNHGEGAAAAPLVLEEDVFANLSKIQSEFISLCFNKQILQSKTPNELILTYDFKHCQWVQFEQFLCHVEVDLAQVEEEEKKADSIGLFLCLDSLSPPLDWLPPDFGASKTRFGDMLGLSVRSSSLVRFPDDAGFLSAVRSTLLLVDFSNNKLKSLTGLCPTSSSLSSCGLPDLRIALFSGNAELLDISGISYCARLVVLDISHTSVHDLSALSHCEHLLHLNAYHCKHLNDLSPLIGHRFVDTYDGMNDGCLNSTPKLGCFKLKSLHLGQTSISDLSVVMLLPQLTTLFADSTPLQQLPQSGVSSGVKTVHLGSTLISNISNFSKLFPNCETLNLSRCPITSLLGLNGCFHLRTLQLKHTCHINQLEGLENCTELTWLDLRHSNVCDLEPLKENIKNLTYLNLCSTKVKDVSWFYDVNSKRKKNISNDDDSEQLFMRDLNLNLHGTELE